MLEQYKALGVSDAVLTFGEGVLADLKDRFTGIDAIAEANQMKVIAAMQRNRLAANHFNLSSGYGYDDEGRDTLERVYADCFGAEAALVRSLSFLTWCISSFTFSFPHNSQRFAFNLSKKLWKKRSRKRKNFRKQSAKKYERN